MFVCIVRFTFVFAIFVFACVGWFGLGLLFGEFGVGFAKLVVGLRLRLGFGGLVFEEFGLGFVCWRGP